MSQASYRFATPNDVPVILDLIKQLAEYEKAADQVVATENLLHESLFAQRAAEVLLVEAGGRAVGFAVFFTSYSTWLARAGIFLEDLFVLPDERGKGYGKGLLVRLAQIAVERGCGRLEWNCLDWNQPSIDFYHSLGAYTEDRWAVLRIDGDALDNLARQA